MRTCFRTLIRFEDTDGVIRYGDTLGETNDVVGTEVSVYEGVHPWDLRASSAVATVARIGGTGIVPLAYKAHLEETGFPAPKFPVYFSKPQDTLAGPSQDIPVPKFVMNLDYEGELCFVVGRDRKDLGEDHDPADYILGFMAGNDVSAREWQTQETAGGQHHVAKSFDNFAPLGPVLASYEAVGDPENLELETLVNGVTRQHSSTSDFLFSLRDIMVHLTRGRLSERERSS